jgi:hypothetical protein
VTRRFCLLEFVITVDSLADWCYKVNIDVVICESVSEGEEAMNRASTVLPRNPLEFRTSLAGVCAILDLEYRTSQVWCKWYGLHGRRSRQRFGLGDMVKFRLVSTLATFGLSRKQIAKSMTAFSWMIAQSESDDNMMFTVRPDPERIDDVAIHAFTVAKYPRIAQIYGESGTSYLSLSLHGITQEVIGRVRLHIEGVAYIAVGDRVKAALIGLAETKKRERILEDFNSKESN